MGDFAGKNVFLFDGAVHSGSKIQNCARKILGLGATGICTYSLVLKHSSKFIPTLWGLSISDTDRAFFLLDSIPNNRLDAGPHQDSPPYVHIRALSENDLDIATVVSGVPSLDRVTWSVAISTCSSIPNAALTCWSRRRPLSAISPSTARQPESSKWTKSSWINPPAAQATAESSAALPRHLHGRAMPILSGSTPLRIDPVLLKAWVSPRRRGKVAASGLRSLSSHGTPGPVSPAPSEWRKPGAKPRATGGLMRAETGHRSRSADKNVRITNHEKPSRETGAASFRLASTSEMREFIFAYGPLYPRHRRMSEGMSHSPA